MKYILIDEQKRREELKDKTREELIEIILDGEEDAEDRILEAKEEYN